MKALLLTSSVLILTILLLRRLFSGRTSARLQYALWLLVAIRLLVPLPALSSPLSVLNLGADSVQSAPYAAIEPDLQGAQQTFRTGALSESPANGSATGEPPNSTTTIFFPVLHSASMRAS